MSDLAYRAAILEATDAKLQADLKALDERIDLLTQRRKAVIAEIERRATNAHRESLGDLPHKCNDS